MTTPTSVASGIRFNDCFFSEPVSFVSWAPPGCPGLFVILTFDPSWAPRPLRPLYFGEFGNNTSPYVLLRECRRVIPQGDSKNVFVSVLPMPFTTTSQRCRLREELISAYNPAYQRNATTSSGELAQKIDELERKHQEQQAQVMMMVAGVNRLFESPAPVQPRRRIGFNPLAEPAG
jgi:hypothetical protein